MFAIWWWNWVPILPCFFFVFCSVTEHRDMLSGQHNWYACSHAQPTWWWYWVLILPCFVFCSVTLSTVICYRGSITGMPARTRGPPTVTCVGIRYPESPHTVSLVKVRHFILKDTFLYLISHTFSNNIFPNPSLDDLTQVDSKPAGQPDHANLNQCQLIAAY